MGGEDETEGRRRRDTYLIQRESWIAWDGEIGVESYVLDFFLRLTVPHAHILANAPPPPSIIMPTSNPIHTPIYLIPRKKGRKTETN